MTNLTVPSLQLEHVDFTYPNGLRAIDDVSFSLAGGTVCALVGVNGSGKSTLFNAIMGILRPQAGRILINGLPVAAALKQTMCRRASRLTGTFPFACVMSCCLAATAT